MFISTIVLSFIPIARQVASSPSKNERLTFSRIIIVGVPFSEILLDEFGLVDGPSNTFGVHQVVLGHTNEFDSLSFGIVEFVLATELVKELVLMSLILQ